jgi:hypothetical protein
MMGVHEEEVAVEEMVIVFLGNLHFHHTVEEVVVAEVAEVAVVEVVEVVAEEVEVVAEEVEVVVELQKHL